MGRGIVPRFSWSRRINNWKIVSTYEPKTIPTDPDDSRRAIWPAASDAPGSSQGAHVEISRWIILLVHADLPKRVRRAIEVFPQRSRPQDRRVTPPIPSTKTDPHERGAIH
eukprot:763418-Prorocentrum_minimum.AAC.5